MKSYQIDSSLIRSYTLSAENAFPKFPYLVSFSDENKTLYYVAAQHGAAINNPTVPIIQKAFEYKPTFLIVEGAESSLGISPEEYVVKRKKEDLRDEDEFLKDLSCERDVAIYIATSSNPPINFWGGSLMKKRLLHFYKKREMNMRTFFAISCLEILSILFQKTLIF